MSIAQRYKSEEVCFESVITVKDDDSKGSTMYIVRTDDKLSDSDLEVLDRALSQSIMIAAQLGLRSAIRKCEEAGYVVTDAG